MVLPNLTSAIIEERKVIDYLLNPAHPDNGGKAAFFAACGFSAANWRVFATAVLEMIAQADVAERVQSAWGEKFVIDGPLVAPTGVTPPVRTVWIRTTGSSRPGW